MSITVDQTWIYRFHDQLALTYQQKGSLLTNIIDPGMVHRQVHAAVDHHERLGNVLANDVVTPFGQTKILNPEHSRRAVNLVSSDAAVLVSDENTLRAMVDPQNGYTTTIVYALGRRADKHIIDASTGLATTAVVGPNSAQITQGSQALPASRILQGTTMTPAAANNDLTLTIIIAAASLLSKAGVPNGMSERFAMYSPGQLTDLMAITQAASSDFTKNQIHDRGTINGLSWEGFQWIEIADVVAPDASTVLGTMLNFNGALRRCLFVHRGAIGLSVARDITTKINERPDLNNSIQVRSLMMQAAVRVWEGGVVAVDVTEK